MKRRGVVPVIEAAIAAVLLFAILFAVLPLGDTADTTPDLQQTLHQSISALDAADMLRTPAVARDVDVLRDRLRDRYPGPVETGLLTVAGPSLETTVNTTHTDVVTVNESREAAQLRVWRRDTAPVNVSVNNATVATYTVDDPAYDVIDIGERVTTGDNTIRFDTGAAVRIGYRAEVVEWRETRAPPTRQDVMTTGYTIAGTNTTFAPAMVQGVTWP